MLEDILRKLRDLERRVEELDGHHEIPFTELLPDEFMLRNTDFATIDALLEASGFASAEDFAAIPDDEWDTFISRHTRFSSWDAMKGAAAQEWAKKRLGLD